jgi:sialate O-acetylesterase
MDILEDVGMVVTTDIGDFDDIHPGNKLAVGERLANWALAKNYGKSEIVYSGPLYKNYEILNHEDGLDTIVLNFNYLNYKSDYQQIINEFESVNHFGKANPIEAKLVNNQIILTFEDVSLVSLIRFAWNDTPLPNFFNEAGLPASPFMIKLDNRN